MKFTIVCHGCDERLTATVASMRRHATVMTEAIEQAETGSLTEEQRKDFTDALIATLNDAQTAWDDYRSHLYKHLTEHGLLPALRSRDAA